MNTIVSSLLSGNYKLHWAKEEDIRRLGSTCFKADRIWEQESRFTYSDKRRQIISCGQSPYWKICLLIQWFDCVGQRKKKLLQDHWQCSSIIYEGERKITNWTNLAGQWTTISPCIGNSNAEDHKGKFIINGWWNKVNIVIN